MRYEEASNPSIAKIRFDDMLDNYNNDMKSCVGKMLDEITRLREVIRSTHTTYCTHDWTSRGLHAPECLLYELEP